MLQIYMLQRRMARMQPASGSARRMRDGCSYICDGAALQRRIAMTQRRSQCNVAISRCNRRDVMLHFCSDRRGRRAAGVACRKGEDRIAARRGARRARVSIYIVAPMQHCNRQHATCNRPQTTCNMDQTTCNGRTCSTHYTSCSTRLTVSFGLL